MDLLERGLTISSAFVLALVVGTPDLCAQTGFERATVTVDDSPVALQSFSEVLAQSADNPDRSAMLIEQLLAEYRDRLLPVPGDPDAFESVRSAVAKVLSTDPGVLKAWRARAASASRRMLETMTGTPERTFDRWPFTEAGLEAGLRSAQLDIEGGEFARALRVLDEIESWTAEVEVAHRVAALRATAAGLAASGQEGADRRELLQLRETALLRIAQSDPARAAKLKDAFTGIVFEPGLSSLATVDPSKSDLLGFGDETWAKIWDDPLLDTLFRRRYFDQEGTTPTSRSRAERARSQATNMTSLPVVVGDVVLVNEGLLLRAWDRLTGRLRWARSFGMAAGLRPSGSVGDLGEITARGAAAITVIGHAFGGGRDGSGEIVRFDPVTSRERWRVRPEGLLEGDALKDAFVSGGPLIIGDIVAVPIRKVNSRLETIQFVAGLDLDSGRPRWVQTIASSGGVRMGANRPFSRLASIDGDIIVSTAVGAVARLDTRTGHPRWLRRFDVPLRPQQIGAQPWEIGGPVVVSSGIACISPGLDEWFLLDAETGTVLQRQPIGPGTIFDDPRYFLAFGPGEDGRETLIGVGRDIIAIDPSDPSTRLWSLSVQNGSIIAERPNRGDRHGIRGRVHAIDRGLAVPFGDSLGVVDIRDGVIKHLVPTSGGGNPVVAGDQFFLANDEHLRAFMPLHRAVDALRGRLEGGTATVDEALALLDLARRAGDIDLAMEASDVAVASLEEQSDPSVRATVLDRLLSVLQEDLLPVEQAERIHDHAQRIATTPSEHVRRLLARGDWSMRHDRGRDAVAAWRSILRESSLADVGVEERGELHRSAGSAAASRINEVRERDPAIAEWLDREQRAAVEEAIALRATAEDLLLVLRAGAGSKESDPAGIRAIEILRDEGRVLEAIGAARLVAAHTTGPTPQRALTLAAEIAAADARPALARQLLREAGRAPRAIAMVAIDVGWLRVSDFDRGAWRVPPRIATASTPASTEHLNGHLATIAGDGTVDRPANRFLVVENRELVSRRADGLGEEWRLWVEDPNLHVVRHTPDIMLWLFPDGHDSSLMAVDGASGAVLWTIDHANDLLPPPASPRRNVEGTRPDRTPFLPWRVEPILTDQGILFVRADGAAALVEPSNEATVRWSADGLLDRVYGSLWDGGLVHLWGVVVDGQRISTASAEAMVVSLDPATGEVVHRAVLGGGDPRWLAEVDGGRLAFATSRAVALIEPLAPGGWSRERWRRVGTIVRDTRRGWSSEGLVVGADQAGALVALDAVNGSIVADRWQTTATPDSLGLPVASIVEMDGLTVLVYPDRVFAFGPDGTLVGSDAIADADRSDWRAIPASDSLVLVSRRVGSSRYVYRIHRLDPATGLRIQGPAFDVQPPGRSYDAARLVDGWLLLGTSGSIDAIPLGTEGQSADVKQVEPK